MRVDSSTEAFCCSSLYCLQVRMYLEVLRPAFSTQGFLLFLRFLSKCWSGGCCLLLRQPTRFKFTRIKTEDHSDNDTWQDRQCTYNVTLKRNHCCLGRATSIKYYRSVSYFSSFIRHTKRMRRIILSYVACLAIPYFFHMISYTTRFSENNLWNTNFFFFFKFLCNLYQKHFSFYKESSKMI